MQWASTLPTKWLYTSIDDDISVNLTKLVEYFNQLVKPEVLLPNTNVNFQNFPIVCVYSYQDRDPPSRNPRSKWYMSEADFPGKFWPVYCRGGAYTTTISMVKKLFQASRRTTRLQLDDVWVTGFMRLKVENTNDNIVVSKQKKTGQGRISNIKFN